MKTPSLNTETDNLVLFPSAKNFPVETKEQDPMMDLLNEFAFLDVDLVESLEADLENEVNEDVTFGSLDAFMNRHQKNDNLTPYDKLILLINDRVKAIADAKDRIKFYLNEIEMFLPKRR